MKIADLYQSVTNRIIFELENGGVPPWLKPWKNVRPTGSLMPHNFATAHAYRGINVPLLWQEAAEKGYAHHLWLSYKQAEGLKGQVRKGERGTHIVFTKKLRGKDEDDNPKQFSMLKTFNVFNIAQIDGLKLPQPEPIEQGSRNDRLDQVIADTNVRINHGGNQACYVPSMDFISMPLRGQFKDEESYYATMFHELGHATGAKHRLDRDLSGRFGTHKYAAEELVAEMCSAFLCASLGVQGELRHVGYLDYWLKLLKEDDRAIFTASSKAQQAADFIHPLEEGAP